MRILFLTTAFYAAVLPILAYPFWGLCYFLWITIFRPEQLAWGETFGHLHLLVAVVTLISWVINSRDSRIPGLRQVPIQVWLMLLIYGATAVVSLTARYPDESWYYSGVLGKVFFMAFLISRLVDRPSRLRTYVRTVGLASGLLAYWAILQYTEGNVRLEGLGTALPDSNLLADTLVMLTPMVLATAKTDTGRWRIMGFGLTGGLILAILLSHSRGAFLSLCVMGVFIVLQSRRKILAGVTALVVAALLFAITPESVFQRVDTITTDEQQMDTSASARVVLWGIGMQIFAAHPVTGVGLEGFSPAKEAYAGEYGGLPDYLYDLIFGRYRVVHNTYVNALAEGGVALAVPFFLFLLSGMFVPLPRPTRASPEAEGVFEIGRGIRVGILAFCVGAFFINANYTELLYWQVILAGVARMILKAEAVEPETQEAVEGVPVLEPA
ncbi:MAG TPA: O-antigen ligase family protein [Candidatus Sulfotelmatobacter sp.]|nr:O-antigen ligase family protein [Candidatus Sulfotelmatobacter sp.]